MKAASRRTTYLKISMIQRWKREKLASDQTFPASVFPFIFQETSDDDLCQMDYVPLNPSCHLVEECENNNISKNQHDPTVDSRDMATGALLVPLNYTHLSSRILYFHPFFFF
jgi:hypothetical protein